MNAGMSKFMPALTTILFFTAVFLALIYLFQTDRLSNPLKDVESKNVVLSTVIGTINNLLGDVPESDFDDENKSLEEKFAVSGYPSELFSFDVTQKKAVFGIVSSNPDEKTMDLRYIFPFVRRDKVIKSVINCLIEESVVISLDQETQSRETVQAKEPLYQIASAGIDTLQGICGDNECSSIVGTCELLKIKRREF